MLAAVFSYVFLRSLRSPRYGLRCISALRNPKRLSVSGRSIAWDSSVSAERVFFSYCFWCLSLETVGEVCNLYNKIALFLYFLPIDFVLHL